MNMVLPDIQSIRRKRKKLDITQKQLAKRAGVSQSLIAKIESGKAEASYEKVKGIFEVLDRQKSKEEKRCHNIMCKKLISVKEDDTVRKAISLMKKHSISQLPVFKGKIVIGSISETALLSGLEKKSKKELFKQKVGKIAEAVLPIVNKELPVSSVIPLLKSSPAVLVSEKGQIKGIITKADLL